MAELNQHLKSHPHTSTSGQNEGEHSQKQPQKKLNWEPQPCSAWGWEPEPPLAPTPLAFLSPNLSDNPHTSSCRQVYPHTLRSVFLPVCYGCATYSVG